MNDRVYNQDISLMNEENLHLPSKNLVFHKIETIEQLDYTGKVYDLKIKNTHNYTTPVGLAHNGGRRPGSACVYLETWHPDIMEFLELKDNTGDPERRSYNLNLANWIPDLFMERVRDDKDWSLIDPAVAPELISLFGEAFNKRYLELEAENKIVSKISARKLYTRMLRTISETGNGWFCFKDISNKACNTAINKRFVGSSNLCLAPNTLIRANIDGDILDIEIQILTEKFNQGSHILVLTLNETTKEYEWQEINNVGLTSTDEQEVIEVDTGITKIECTADHLFLTKNRGWVKAGELLENDEFVDVDLVTVSKLEKIDII